MPRLPKGWRERFEEADRERDHLKGQLEGQRAVFASRLAAALKVVEAARSYLYDTRNSRPHRPRQMLARALAAFDSLGEQGKEKP